MQLSLRPYLTAGVAIAGASVIAVAPIQPTLPDVQVSNPVAAVSRDVQLAGFIDETTNDLIFALTQAGFAIQVPITAALLEAIAPDLIPDGQTAETVATVLLLGLEGFAISGGGSIGTALQGVVDGFGEDFGTGLVALLVGAPSTILEGYVLGGFGPDLLPLINPDADPTLAPEIFAGGLLQNLGLRQGPLVLPGPTIVPPGFQVCLALTCDAGAGLTLGDTVLPSFFFTTNKLLQGLLDTVDVGGGSGLLDGLPDIGGALDNLTGGLDLPELPGLGGLLGGSSTADLASADVVDPAEENVVTLDALPNKGLDASPNKGKDTAPGLTRAAPIEGVADQASETAKNVTDAVATGTPGRGFGSTVVGNTPATGKGRGGQDLVRNSVVFAPPTDRGDKSTGAKGAGTAPGRTISGIAKNIGDTVRNALGGGGSQTTETDDE